MKTDRTLALAAYMVVLGILACVGWIFIGQTDDAPGAGMIGILAALSSVVVAYRIVRRTTAKG